MRELLKQSNLDLLREIDQLNSVLGRRFGSQRTSELIPELIPYYEAVDVACNQMRIRIERSLRLLASQQDDILIDILSETQEITRLFHLYNLRLLSPLLRHRESDRLCLQLLRWLHEQHPETKDFPVGLSDGEFGIWPVPVFPIVYFMPASAQHGLLYLPLFFHEFGHLLFACHREELDDLVRDFQEHIHDLLTPIAQRDDRHSKAAEKSRIGIIETWYKWMEELFCDSVGFRIGGMSFVHAFSMYLRMHGREQFQVSKDELVFREHPVTWLRVRVLAEQMRRSGLMNEADELEKNWRMIAEELKIREEYFGYFDETFLPLICRALNDMLVEADPRSSTESDAQLEKSISSESTFVHILNYAWGKFLKDPGSYADWQNTILETIVSD